MYDQTVFPCLCNTIYELLEKENSFAIIASTLRDVETLDSFRKELGNPLVFLM